MELFTGPTKDLLRLRRLPGYFCEAVLARYDRFFVFVLQMMWNQFLVQPVVKGK
jgi:hypothetical protein